MSEGAKKIRNAISIIYKFLDEYRLRLACVTLAIIILALFLQWYVPDEKAFTIFGRNIFSIISLVAAAFGGVLMGTDLVDIRSHKEKIDYELSTRFSDEQSKILFQIVEEKDEDEKKKLRLRGSELRQEYESLLGESLREKGGLPFKDWREYLLAAHKRLTNEEQRLLARNRANIRSGIGLALLGAILPAAYLYYLLFIRIQIADNGIVFSFINYLPAVSVVFILETVAVFYLRLYSATERRIEKNKNELTNIELRLTSGAMLYEKTRKTKFAELADTLSKEERNFVLKKNESSATADTDKVDIDRAVEIAIKAMKAGIS